MKILIYEDNKYKKLFPLSMLRSVYDVRCGANTIKQRIENIVNGNYEILLHCRNILYPYLNEIHKNKINRISKDDYLLLNGRIIFTEKSLKYLLSKKEKDSFYTYKNEIAAAYFTKDKCELLKNKIESKNDNTLSEEFFTMANLKQVNLKNSFDITVIDYPWNLIRYILEGGLNDDIEYYLRAGKKFYKLKDRVNYINRKKLFVGKNVNLFPDIVLDALQGSIIIEEGVTIEPFTYVKGPAFIGRNSLVKSGAKIYGPCVIGEYSKVAGEVAESVFHSYVNKQHDGFIGHSYICPFVNLGADTVTSDLKNNYSSIKVKLNDENINTEMQFLGSIIGDHSKTSINTMLNTGSNIGIFANIFGNGFPDKEIKSFSWNESGKSPVKYDLTNLFETANIVMERRGIQVSKAYGQLVEQYYRAE